MSEQQDSLSIVKTCVRCNNNLVRGVVSCSGCALPYHPSCARLSSKTSSGSFNKCCGSRPSSPTIMSTDDFQKMLTDAIAGLHVKLSEENSVVLNTVKSIDKKLDSLVERVSSNEKTIKVMSSRLDKVEGGDSSFTQPLHGFEKQRFVEDSKHSELVGNNGQNQRTVGTIKIAETGVADPSGSRRGEPQDCLQEQYTIYNTDKKVGKVGSSYQHISHTHDSQTHPTRPSDGVLHSSSFEIYYQNVRGLRTKLLTLRKSIPVNSAVVFVFTETWLHSSINSNELGFKNFTIYRCDRSSLTSSSLRGGGVLIAVNNDFPSVLIPTRCSTIEMVFIRVKVFGVWHIFGAVYIPPNSNVNVYNDFFRNFKCY
ncbi:uncharacterized protein LOC122507201 [Leptopilina heterotoma]|uniref:uncharacterized protein LOC122504399 n=1 Tax=Leptopilina heterotoma TaxID=63436 RepID=UPI001CA8B671|nr:uncharacterized protein LOC122504399 [Leptopilina heterotoma]XP_043475740.1 uncharacterized protein LOC122507201 [Leptopilina heterotoma]